MMNTDPDTWGDRIRWLLERTARSGEGMSATILNQLDPDRPGRAEALDRISEQEHQAGRPLLSAVVPGSTGPYADRFFALARRLGRYTAEPDTPAARDAFLAQERENLRQVWTRVSAGNAPPGPIRTAEEKQMTPDVDVRTVAVAPPTYGFTADVGALAAKPGQDLGSVSFQNPITQEAVQLRVIEGAQRNALSFRGISTSFERTQILNFHLQGPALVDLLEDLPYSPYDTGAEIEYKDFSASPINAGTTPPPVFTHASIVYSRVRSETGEDPDGAVIKLATTDSNQVVFVYISGIKRGAKPIVTQGLIAFIVSAVLLLTAVNPSVNLSATVSAGGTTTSLSLQTGLGPSDAPLPTSRPATQH